MITYRVTFATLFVCLVLGESSSRNDIVTYEEVEASKDNTTVYLIDVRQPCELTETGFIPGAINIPINKVEDTLKNFSPEDFSQKFQRSKPELDSVLVFYCTVGVRSAKAQQIALDLGYVNAKNYLGSWLDWRAKSNLVKTT
ncbi:putative rhodanese [Trypoxylus dichotomus]